MENRRWRLASALDALPSLCASRATAIAQPFLVPFNVQNFSKVSQLSYAH